MKHLIRIIPRLDIKGSNLVKGVNLEGLRVLGSPNEFAKYYYEQGADELFYQDAVASLYSRNSLKKIITDTAKNIFIPLTVGGGIRNVADISEILRSGADKVSINSAAVKNPKFISEAAEKFGKSTIAISIETIKQKKGNYLVFTENGRNCSGKDVFQWAQQAEELGAGEIILTSVDKEGTGGGMDIQLVKELVKHVNIPVVSSGGIGKKEHCIEILKIVPVSGVAIGSMFHYECLSKQNFNLDKNQEGNIEYLKKKSSPSNISKCNINTLKKELLKNKIYCRFNEEKI
tara:strand:- start:3011 stop:3877 length:867 start_codon:yes stop_codon:yes gene_type:complete